MLSLLYLLFLFDDLSLLLSFESYDKLYFKEMSGKTFILFNRNGVSLKMETVSTEISKISLPYNSRKMDELKNNRKIIISKITC